MSDEVITAYKSVAIPAKQEQSLPGLDRDLKPGIEYTQQEVWDDEGKPHLQEYVGSGKLKGKTALVTGGDSGIGRAAAIMFAMEGARGVTITYLPEERPDAEDAAKAIEAAGAKALIVECNLEEESSCRKIVDEHIKTFGTLNVLVNNASKQVMEKEFQDVDLEATKSIFNCNILQMFAVTRFALPHMKRGASIINSTSITAYKGSPQLVSYSSTKGAIVTFTRSLAVQLAPAGIRVNAVAPGTIMTALQAATRPAEQMEGLGVGKIPLHNRPGQPAEMGPGYVFLASSDSNAMTGQVLHMNMGAHLGAS